VHQSQSETEQSWRIGLPWKSVTEKTEKKKRRGTCGDRVLDKGLKYLSSARKGGEVSRDQYYPFKFKNLNLEEDGGKKKRGGGTREKVERGRRIRKQKTKES
jgi:hypothetical protein